MADGFEFDKAGTSGPESEQRGDNGAAIGAGDGITPVYNPDAIRNSSTATSSADSPADNASGPDIINPASDTTSPRRGRHPRNCTCEKCIAKARGLNSGPGIGHNSQAKAAPINVNGLEKIFFSIHSVLASLTGVEELEIDEAEAKQLSAAIAGVAEQYALTLDAKTVAYIELTRVLGVIYGPRAVSIYLRTRKPKPSKPQAVVTNIRPEPDKTTGQMPAFDTKNIRLD